MTREKLIQNHLRRYFETTADEVLEGEHFSAAKSYVDSPYYNSATFLSEHMSDADLSASLEEIKRFYRSHGIQQFCIWDYSYNSIKDTLPPNTFRVDPVFTGLFRQLDETLYTLEHPSELTYKIVESSAELDDFFIPFTTAFQFSDEVSNNIKNYYHKMLENSDLIHYLVYHDEKPVACGSLFVVDGVAGLYNLSVLPEYRNKGIAKTLQKMRLNDAKKMGLKSALIQAAPITEHTSKQLSFQAYTRITPLVYEGEKCGQ